MNAYPNHAKLQLQAGKVSLGMGLRQARTVDIAAIAKTCGFDWLFIDMEHNSMDVDCAAQGIFTWGETTYHCLADMSLWLRLLARGEAYYCAAALSEYRVHPGQEQRAAGIECITERYDLAAQARLAGFLREPAQYRTALARVDVLANTWAKQPGLDGGERDSLAALSRTIAGELARLAP